MDDWGDPWADDAPKRPPAIEVLGAPSKERVVTPVLGGFFDEPNWGTDEEADASSVWAKAQDAPPPPAEPAWDVPGPDDAPPPATAQHSEEELPPLPAASDVTPPPPADDPPVDDRPDSLFHDAEPPCHVLEESGAPPATPTTIEVDSSDSGTTIGPDSAGLTPIDTSAPAAARSHSEEFESATSTRPSTSPSEASHGEVSSDSTRTSFEDDTGAEKPGEIKHVEEQALESGTVEEAPEEQVEAASNEDNAPEHDNDTPEDDDDDFGDFEEETEEAIQLEEAESASGSPVEAGAASASSSQVPSARSASAADAYEFPLGSPKPFVKADFQPDLGLLDQLFPAPGEKDALPEVVDSPIAPTNARKAWYRLNRKEPLREFDSGNDHENYVRIGWQSSNVRVEVNKVVSRWASEDRINGRTLLGGKPGAIFGWDYPVSPASSIFSQNSHKRNASAATTPKKATFDVEAKERPQSLMVPTARKASIAGGFAPQFSWSSTDDPWNEPAASSAPPLKTSFGTPDDQDPNPSDVPSIRKSSVPNVSFAPQFGWSSMPEEPQRSPALSEPPIVSDSPFASEIPAISEPLAASEPLATPEPSVSSSPTLKATLAVSSASDNPWAPSMPDPLDKQGFASTPALSASTPLDKENQRLGHMRTVSDSRISMESSSKTEFSDNAPKKKSRLPSWNFFKGRKKSKDLSAHKRSVSSITFSSSNPNELSAEVRSPPVKSSLPSWESPWSRTTPKSPLANEVPRPEPEPELEPRTTARSPLVNEVSLPVPKKEQNPWDNAFDNAWDDARPSTAKTDKSHQESDALTVKTSTPAQNTFDTSLAVSKSETRISAQKPPPIDTGLGLPKIETTTQENKSWGDMVESPMSSSPAMMAPDENPWGGGLSIDVDPWRPTAAEPPASSRPSINIAPLDTSAGPRKSSNDEDDDWGDMVESPVPTSPALSAPASDPWQLPRSVSPANTVRAHPPSPLAPSPVRSSTLPLPQTPTIIAPPRLNPPSAGSWTSKSTNGRTSPALFNQPRPLSPLNPARSSTLPVSPSTTSLPTLSPAPQQQFFQPPPAAPQSSTTASDPWAAVDFSIFDKPAAPAARAAAADPFSRNRTSSNPVFPSSTSSTNQTTTTTTPPPVITFDKIMGGGDGRDRSSSTPITFDQILQPSRGASGQATTFDDILAAPGQLSASPSQENLKESSAQQQLQRSPSMTGWAEQDKEFVRGFVAGLPDLAYMLR